MDIHQHNVVKIEICLSYSANGGSRTMRITSKSAYSSELEVTEITVYGETDALEALPKSDDYRNYDPPVGAPVPVFDEVV